MFKRIQFFEIQDLAWLPSPIRNGVTDYLQFLLNFFNIYSPAASVLEKLIDKDETLKIIDLCSGSGGPIVKLARRFPTNRFFLSDLYPNMSKWEFIRNNSSNIDFIPTSLDAKKLLKEENCLYTMFTSFHHFDDNSLKELLKSISKTKSKIAIFEFVQRDLLSLLLVIPSPIFMFLLIPFVRPFSVSRLFYTYIIPLIPFITFWDIVVTVLRIRKKNELYALTQDLKDYEFHYHEERTTLFLKMSAFYGEFKNEE